MATTTINVNASFTGLSDTPSSYTGQAGKAVFVNGTATGLEFGTVSGGDNLFTANLTLGANRTHDMNGNSMTFLKSRVEFRASDGLSANKALVVRNHLNTSDLFSVANDGYLKASSGATIPGITFIDGLNNNIYASGGALFINAHSTLTLFAENKPLIASINNYPALVHSMITLETPDVTMWNGSMSFYVDEVNNDVKIKVRKSDGTFFTKTI
jgi:hypothetical protein